MPKMKSRNAQLKSALGAMAPKERVQEVLSIPKENTKNRQGFAAYSLPDELRLISMLNTLKIEPQCYRSENQTMRELRDLIERIGSKDPYFVAQAIVYSRCMGEGMRSINHLGAALLAPFASGTEWAKRFYGRFDRKKQGGGCIYRTDDMSEIKDIFATLNTSALSAAMKTGFRSVLESLDAYQLAKYAKTTRDIANLVHPNPEKSAAMIVLKGKDAEDYCKVKGYEKGCSEIKVHVLDAILAGITVSADTWEVANSEAGQEVAKAVKEGKITKAEAEVILSEAKADNWESLLKEGKLGVIAALRNIRNILRNPRQEIIDNWCALIKDTKKVRQALVLPIHFDLAYDIVDTEFHDNKYANIVRQALQDGYLASIPNLAPIVGGKTLIVVDNSGSMGCYDISDGKKASSCDWGARRLSPRSCGYKAGLIAATFAAATGADIIRFGSNAYRYNYDKNKNVFALAREICTASDGYTNPAAVFELIRKEKAAYDRIIFISDNEVNGELTSAAYKSYIHDVCSPYIYGIDLASYGTTPLKNDGKVQYFFGYGPSLYDAIASSEFNPMQHIEKVKKVVI